MATPPRGTVRQEPPLWRRHLFRVVPLLLLGFGVAAMVGSYRLSLGSLGVPGPGLWPFMVSALITATAAALVVIDDPEDYEPWTRGAVRILIGLASLGVFIVLFQAIGFLISAALLLVFWLRFFAQESWRFTLPVAVVAAVLFHLLFVEALGVPFPPGVLLGAAG